MQQQPVTVAQISDLHIAARTSRAQKYPGSAKRLRSCIAELNRRRADLVIATGDLTHYGREEEYAQLREILRELAAPIYLLPGNHDDREALRRAFPDHAYLHETPEFIGYALDAGPMRIVALDSTQPGKVGGYLDERRLTWLRSRLEETQRPTLLALHHPPFKTGVWPMDSFGFVNLDALGALVERNPHVQRVVAGHVHSVRSAQLGGSLALTSPAMTSHLLLRTPPWGYYSLAFERAGFLLHSCGDDGTISTAVVRINGNGKAQALLLPS